MLGSLLLVGVLKEDRDMYRMGKNWWPPYAIPLQKMDTSQMSMEHYANITTAIPKKNTTTHTHTHTTVRETHQKTPTHSILWSVHFSIGKRKIVPLMMSFLPPCCYTCCFYLH